MDSVPYQHFITLTAGILFTLLGNLKLNTLYVIDNLTPVLVIYSLRYSLTTEVIYSLDRVVGHLRTRLSVL